MIQLLVSACGVLAVVLWPGREDGWPLGARRAEPGARPRTGGRIGIWRARKPDAAREQEIVGLLDALVPALRSGVAPADALMLVAQSEQRPDEHLGDAARAMGQAAAAAAEGAALGGVWHQLARRMRCPELHLLGAAWSLTEELGSPLASAVGAVTETLRSRAEHRREVEVATAGARATTNLLTLLPIGGIGLSLLLGLSPAVLYASPLPLLSLGFGVALLMLGRWWIRRLVAIAVRTPVPR